MFNSTFTLLAQEKAELKGYIRSEESGKALTGATIYFQNVARGTITNDKGFYSIKLPLAIYHLTISYLGFTTIKDSIDLQHDTQKNYIMHKATITGREVTVSARNSGTDISSTSPAKFEVINSEIKELPSLLGEPDIMRIIQMTPGVQSANEGNSGFYVHGGTAGQNLILFDNTTIYNPFHVLGFLSVFNADCISKATIMKSGLTADYGGRISSVVEVESKNGNFDSLSGDASIGLISSRLTLSGPLIKNKLSLLTSGRISYLDYTLKPLVKPFIGGESDFYSNSNYGFYDINAKLTYRKSVREKLSLTFYKGKDNYALDQQKLGFENNMNWGNTLISCNYNKLYNNDLSLRATAGYTNYYYTFNAAQYQVNIGLFSAVRDFSGKIKLDYRSHRQNLLFGTDYTHHQFIPNNLQATASGLDLNFGPNRILQAHELSAFIQDEFFLTDYFSISAGIRPTIYLQTGPYTEYVQNVIGEVNDTVTYSRNSIVSDYKGLEPRINIRYQLTLSSALKASYTRSKQYIHLASSSSVNLPEDVWLPSTNSIRPEEADQFTLGYYRNSRENKYIFSSEAYYKKMTNQIELLYGLINDFKDNTFEKSITVGKGLSYGIEFQLRKTNGKITGWLSYTLSRTINQFDKINEGKIYPAHYDRTHDINLVLAYKFSRHWTFSSTFIFASGNAYTMPSYKYLMEGNVITGYSSTDAFRMPAYNRLDIAAEYGFKTGKMESKLNFSIFNVYNRANPFFIYFKVSGDVYHYNLKITPKEVTLFPMIPSVSYLISF